MKHQKNMDVSMCDFPVLTATGDIVIRHRLFDERGVLHPDYADTLDYLRQSDLVWGSCEVQFARQGYRTDAPIAYLADPAIAGDLGRAGFDIMTVATNHTCDFGPAAFLETLGHLEVAGITPVGGGRTIDEATTPKVVTAAGRRIGFLAVSCLVPPDYAATEARPGIAPLRVDQWAELHPILLATEPGAPLAVRSRVRSEDLARLVEAIRALRPRVDYLVVSVHWGYGRGDPQAEYQRPLGHAIIDAGADLVLGNHPHSPAGLETYLGRPILYSLGNHIAQQDWANATPVQRDIFAQIDPWSLVSRITFGAGGIQSIEFRATECDAQGMPNLIAKEEAARPILDRFRRLSETMGTSIEIDGLKAVARFAEAGALPDLAASSRSCAPSTASNATTIKKRILIVSLGGTITMTRTAGSGLIPALAQDVLLRQDPALASLAEIETWPLAALPSASLRIAEIVELARGLRRRFAEGCDGAVVLQGTDTLEETAFLLDCLLSGPQPVVVTGAMRGSDAAGADGPANLADAVRTAAAEQSRGMGALVVFDGEIHAARFVRKIHTLSLSAFRSVGRAALGRVVEDEVHFSGVVSPRVPIECVDPARERPVALFRFAMGADDRILKSLPDLGYGGLIIEGAGGGHVSAALMPAVRALAASMPVVLASRCPEGPVLRSTYAYPGSEVDLLSAGVLHAGDLCGLKARLLLSLLLMADGDPADVASRFRARAVSGSLPNGESLS